MTTPLRIEPQVTPIPAERTGRTLTRRALALIGVGALCLLLIGLAVGMQCTRVDRVRQPTFETACFGSQPVCLVNNPRLPFLDYYKKHALLLGSVLWRGDALGLLNCVAFAHYLICPSDDPRVRGSVWQFEPVDLGMRFLPRGLTPTVGPELHPLAAAYIERLRQDRQDPTYWLGTAISEPICTAIASGDADDAGTCEQWFTHAALAWPYRESATVADIDLLDLGRRVRR